MLEPAERGAGAGAAGAGAGADLAGRTLLIKLRTGTGSARCCLQGLHLHSGGYIGPTYTPDCSAARVYINRSI